MPVLTARFVASVTSDVGEYFNDEHVPGLALWVGASGDKSWSVRYRVNGTRKRLALGNRKVLDLAEARAKAKAALKLVTDGVDPAEERASRREAETVADYVKTYIEGYAKRTKKSWKADEMRLRLDVLPHWKNRLMVDITKRDVRELLQGIVDRGAPVVANRVYSLLAKMFRNAVEDDVVELSPVTATRRPGGKEHHRQRVLTHDELRTFWARSEGLGPHMRAFWRLRLLLGQRGGEVAGMAWSDIDLVSGWWTLPTSKNGRSHRVPLSAPAIEIIAELLQLSHKDDRLVLAAHARRADVGALGKRQQAQAAASFGITDFAGHDLRRTGASMMTELGIDRVVVGKLLNHTERGVTGQVYDTYNYAEPKRDAVDRWAAHLLGIVRRQKDEACVAS